MENQVDVSGLEASLSELVKAADATDLVKGNGVNLDYSGRYDERGKGGGGGADRSDEGGLDNMMIGKMEQTVMSALADAGFSAPQIAAFMSAKDEGEEEEEEDSEEDAEEDADEMSGEAGGGFFQHSRPAPHGKMAGKPSMPPFAKKSAAYSEGEPLTKSIDALRADSDISDAIDVSSYLEAMTGRVAEQMDSLAKGIHGGHVEQRKVNRAFAAALWQTGKLVKSQAQVINALGQRLGLVETQPAPARGVQSPTRAQALAKSMPGEAGSGGGRLGKSEILNTLSYMLLEKGVKEINGPSTREVIGLFEGGNVIAPETVGAIESFLRQHPGETQKARSYR
jgi:hypothetical protein